MAYKYTDAEFDAIKALYAAGTSLEDIQAKYTDKSVASIRMKLVKAGVYSKVVGTKVQAARTASEPKPTTKAGIKAAYKAASDAVGPAPW